MKVNENKDSMIFVNGRLWIPYDEYSALVNRQEARYDQLINELLGEKPHNNACKMVVMKGGKAV